MLNYQYECKSCETVFTVRKRMSDRNESPECPECGSNQTRRKMGATNVSCGSTSSPG